jgi:mannan endo-1,4-beta-mannosidase
MGMAERTRRLVLRVTASTLAIGVALGFGVSMASSTPAHSVTVVPAGTSVGRGSTTSSHTGSSTTATGSTTAGTAPASWSTPATSAGAKATSAVTKLESLGQHVGPMRAAAPKSTPAPTAATSTTTTTSTTPPAVTVTSLSPSSVTSGGGTPVTITGNGFTGASVVNFGPNASSAFTVVSAHTITAVAPVGAGVVTVSIVSPAGTSPSGAGNQLTYQSTGQLPITTSGQNLEVGGVPTKFTGVNAYELATSWGTNAGCGGMATSAQINALFSSLKPGSLVRFWAFQGTLATNLTTHTIDWAPLDQIFYLAAQDHVYLIPTITDQGGTCDGNHWQDPSWYTGGYQQVFNTAANSDGRGLTPLSYWSYMQDLVNRYKNSPALGMWEPISEAEASTCPAGDEPLNCSGNQTCPNESVAAAALTSFFNNVGGEIHSLDPTHLVEAGFLGGGQCGTSGPDFQSVGQSPGINVLSVHDYYGSAAMGGDQWNGMAVRFNQARAINKPIITGEAGIQAGNVPGCESLNQRASDMQAKMTAQFAAGDSAFLVWDWVTDPLGPCSYNTGAGDPLMGALDG